MINFLAASIDFVKSKPLMHHSLRNLLPPTLFTLLSVTSVLAQSKPAGAETSPEADALKPIIVTASRLEETKFESPNRVETLDADQFIKRGGRTLVEELATLPGINAQKTGNGQGSPYIRGFTGMRNLAMIDGIRFNNSVFREGPNQYWATIDAYSMDRLEVLYGPAATLYGSDSIGGTLNVLTKHSHFREKTEGEFFQQGSAYYRFDTASESHVTRFEQAIGQGDVYGLHVGFSYKDYGDIRAADIGRQLNTGYNEWAADARFDYAISKDTTLTIAHQQLEQDDVWRTHDTPFAFPWRGLTPGTNRQRLLDQQRSLSYIRLKGENTGSFVDAYEATLSYQRTDEVEDRIRARNTNANAVIRELSGFDVDTFGAALQLESDWAGGRLVYGTDFYHDEVDSFRSDFRENGTLIRERIQGPVGNDASYNLFGVFAQNKTELDAWSFIYGTRYTYAQANANNLADAANNRLPGIHESWDNISFNGRVQYDITPETAVYAGIAQGFRAPNLSDTTRSDIGQGGGVFELQSPNVQPEKTLTYEIGSRYESDTVHTDLSLFYTAISDGITRTPTGGVVGGLPEVRGQNTSDGYVYGLELAADWEFVPSWTVFGNFSWLDGKQDVFATAAATRSTAEPINRLTPVLANVGIRWEATEDLWFETSARIASQADKINTSERTTDRSRITPGGTPSYVVVGVRGGWQATDNLLLTAGLENLTDEEYRAHGSGQNEPGFGAVVGAKVSW